MWMWILNNLPIIWAFILAAIASNFLISNITVSGATLLYLYIVNKEKKDFIFEKIFKLWVTSMKFFILSVIIFAIIFNKAFIISMFVFSYLKKTIFITLCIQISAFVLRKFILRSRAIKNILDFIISDTSFMLIFLFSSIISLELTGVEFYFNEERILSFFSNSQIFVPTNAFVLLTYFTLAIIQGIAYIEKYINSKNSILSIFGIILSIWAMLNTMLNKILIQNIEQNWINNDLSEYFLIAIFICQFLQFILFGFKKIYSIFALNTIVIFLYILMLGAMIFPFIVISSIDLLSCANIFSSCASIEILFFSLIAFSGISALWILFKLHQINFFKSKNFIIHKKK